MSIDCQGCFSTICQPDIPWYAGTRFSRPLNYICGTCVSVIPHALRRPVSEMQDFEISFGTIFAEIGSHRRYQGYDSRNGRPLFAVSAKTILDNIPFSEQFLQELYPYWCMDLYCHNLVGCKDSSKALASLWKYREAVSVWLSMSPPPLTNLSKYNEFGIDPGSDNLEPPYQIGFRIKGKELTLEENKEMDELLGKIAEWNTQ